MKKFFIALVIVILVGAIALGAIVFRPLISNPIDEVDSSLYRGSFSIIYLGKSPLFKSQLSDTYELLSAENKLKELFAKDDSEEQYRAKFDALIVKLDHELTDFEKLFVDCAFGVWYAEYMAKGYEMDRAWLGNSEGGILDSVSNLLYGNSADEWRLYADNSFEMLKDAKTVQDLEYLKDYLNDRGTKLYF